MSARKTLSKSSKVAITRDITIEHLHTNDTDNDDDDKIIFQVNVRVEGSKWREVNVANAKVTIFLGVFLLF